MIYHYNISVTKFTVLGRLNHCPREYAFGSAWRIFPAGPNVANFRVFNAFDVLGHLRWNWTERARTR
jgi:hypothetical protein